MADYTVRLTRKAQKQLNKLSDKMVAPLLEAIGKLAGNPRPPGSKRLQRP